ncbi:putative acetyltransferase (GNAT) domain containing protein [Lyophyllum shimeji]|uniref:Acetyltransferase (GNAT) domain containing protein n=1 Tax=Lyophyllum shimeji TaxID=47721 RepID=A0A9P3PVX0_LYOSH|nr:putative acetyltransferase (GNAT) domain containing protein [Lyophyllum shimeji]
MRASYIWATQLGAWRLAALKMFEDRESPTLPLLAGPMIAVDQLKYSDIFRAAKGYQESFAQDPVFRYLRNNRKQTRADQMLEYVVICTSLFLSIQTKIALTVNCGTANITAVPPKADSGRTKQDPATKLAEWLMKKLVKKRKEMVRDPEAKKRQQEIVEKTRNALERALGDRIDKMWLVESLWTDPASQGRGYGGALLDSVTILADWAGQSTWLQSSNVANTAFYERHGFETLAIVLLGDENPTWHEKPVVMSIMVREPRWPLRVDFDVV